MKRGFSATQIDCFALLNSVITGLLAASLILTPMFGCNRSEEAPASDLNFAGTSASLESKEVKQAINRKTIEKYGDESYLVRFNERVTSWSEEFAKQAEAYVKTIDEDADLSFLQEEIVDSRDLLSDTVIKLKAFRAAVESNKKAKITEALRPDALQLKELFLAIHFAEQPKDPFVKSFYSAGFQQSKPVEFTGQSKEQVISRIDWEVNILVEEVVSSLIGSGGNKFVADLKSTIADMDKQLEELDAKIAEMNKSDEQGAMLKLINEALEFLSPVQTAHAGIPLAFIAGEAFAITMALIGIGGILLVIYLPFHPIVVAVYRRYFSNEQFNSLGDRSKGPRLTQDQQAYLWLCVNGLVCKTK